MGGRFGCLDWETMGFEDLVVEGLLLITEAECVSWRLLWRFMVEGKEIF